MVPYRLLRGCAGKKQYWSKPQADSIIAKILARHESPKESYHCPL